MVILVPHNLKAITEAYMGIIIRQPCGCALCYDIAAFQEQRRKARAEEKARFEKLVDAIDPPRYLGMITQVRVGTRWPGTTIDMPRTDNWIRDCIEGG